MDEPGGLSWSLGRLLDSAGAAAKRLAFPLTLIVIVVIFLLVQGEVDRRDPKLAKAAINSELDLVSFQ
jgi:ATP-dependent protease ClpP protease subunit